MVYLEAMGQPILILGTLDRTEDLMEKHATMYSDRPTLPVGQLYVFPRLCFDIPERVLK
jgi:hypothetical protein